MHIYIAGPMRGKVNWNYDAFEAAEGIWQRAGWYVFNPARMGRAVGYTPEFSDGNCPQHLRNVILCDISCIFICDAIAVLPGWEGSIGSTVEVALAQFLGLPIHCAVTMKKLSIITKPWSSNSNLSFYVKQFEPLRLNIEVYSPGHEAKNRKQCDYCALVFIYNQQDETDDSICTVDRFTGPVKLCINCYKNAGNTVR